MFTTRTRLAVGAFAAAILPAIASAQVTTTQQALIFTEQRLDETGGGLGRVLTVLTLNNTGNISSGCVGFNGSVDVSTDCGFANNTVQTSTQTRTLAELLGVGTGSGVSTLGTDLRIVGNFTEPSGNSVIVEQLELRLFDANGGLLFSGTLGTNGPRTFDPTGTGAGNFGFPFAFTAVGASAFQLAVNSALAAAGATTSNIRIGLGAELSNVQGGIDTFSLGRVATSNVVPEPSTYALMATGLLAMGGVASRRRRGA
jgi:hypothetical protein